MTPTLIDQVGAMNVVDKLRFENRRVQDYMNTAEQKALLVEKIAAGYKAEGTEVPLATIQEGVEQWYRNRLAYRHSLLPWYFSIYIRRDRWLKPAVLLLVLSCSVTVAMLVASGMRHQGMLERSSAAISSVSLSLAQLKEGAVENRGNFSEVTGEYPFIAEAKSALDDNTQSLISLEQKIHKDAERKNAEIQNSQVPDIASLNNLLEQYRTAVTERKALLNRISAFKALVRDLATLKSNPAIQTHEALELSVQRADELLVAPGLNLANARAAVDALKAKLAAAAQVPTLKNEIAQLLERSLRQLQVNDDKNRVRALANRLTLAADNLLIPPAEELDELRYLEMLSRTQVRLVVNPDSTQKSGVEREFSESGGKAWYIIAQPLDDAQSVVNLRIKSVETGREQFTSLFGVRVSEEQYERLKQDKLVDGIVNNNQIGVKPVGQFAFEFASGFSPEYLLEW